MSRNIKITNNLKIPLHIMVFDDDNKVYDKGVIQAYDVKIFDLKNNTKIVRFLSNSNIISNSNTTCIIGDYQFCNSTKEIILGKIIAKKQIVASGYVTWKDMPELRFHNLTSRPLIFNGHIMVPPRDTITYTGREQSGIQAGFLLVNDDQIFQDFQIMRPVTDVYYGVIFDRDVPVYTERYLI